VQFIRARPLSVHSREKVAGRGVCARTYCQLVFASDTATRLAISQAAENKVHHVSHADAWSVCLCVREPFKAGSLQFMK
jgi:hypothetical protein